MRKGWEVWISILLLLLGSTCLFFSTMLPFSLHAGWLHYVHFIIISLLLLLVVIFLWLYLQTRSQADRTCNHCKFALQKNWRYCPRCGTEDQM